MLRRGLIARSPATNHLKVAEVGRAGEALGEAVEPVTPRRLGPAVEVGGAVGRPVELDDPQRGDVLEGAQLVGGVGQRSADLRPLGDRRLQAGLESAVAAEKVRRCLGSDARGAGQAVGRVAAERDEVGHEARGDAVALLDLVGVDLLEAGRAGLGAPGP